MSSWMFEMLPHGAFEPRPDGGMRLHGSKGSDAPAPDPRLVEAQIKSMGIQDQAIEEIMANTRQMQPLIKDQMAFGLSSAKQAFEQSQADRSYALERRGELTGMQNLQLEEAKNFDATVRGDQLAREAQADVGIQVEAARQAETRRQQRMGVNPSSGKAVAVGGQMAIAEAAAKAGASNVARERGRNEKRALVDRATNSLAGFPNMGMQTTGAGAGFGMAGLGLTGQGLSTLNSGQQSAISGAGAMGSNATGMYGAQASYKNAQDQIAASSDPFNTVLGAAAGVATSKLMGSDRRLKTDITLVGRLANGLGVYAYRYISGGPMQLGVMADEVAQVVPAAYVEGGAGNGFDAVDYGVLAKLIQQQGAQ